MTRGLFPRLVVVGDLGPEAVRIVSELAAQAPRPYATGGVLRRSVSMPLGVTGFEAATSLKAALGGCPHHDAEPVILTTGETVAAVCPSCLEPLPASWVGSDWKP